MPAPRWRIELLGGVRLSRDGAPLPLPRTQKAAALLAFLALRPREHARDELADLFWPDAPSFDDARASLRNALSLLRRTLGDGLLRVEGRRAVSLTPGASSCDAPEFESAVRAKDWAGARRLWGGPLLPGFWDEWAAEERERLNDLWALVPRPEADPPPLCLPLQTDRFFGREGEMDRLAALLTAETCGRLVTLLGPGGVGKTRLAAEVARRYSAGLFPGGTWFAPLADVNEPARILPIVRDVLGLPRAAGADPLEQIARRLAAGPRCLLILDNFEHIAPLGAPAVVALRARVPALTCLVTSRRRLGLSGERAFEVPPLMEGPGADLFRDRAGELEAGAEEVAALVRGLEGVPLAIELCAARAGVFTVAEMRARLAERFALLTNAGADKGGRHRSLHAAIDWSCRLLTPQQRRLFLRLSCFRGGWTREAAEVVCEEPDAAECLAQLRERSLIVAAGAVAGAARFRMLETLREFAGEVLPADERAANEARHAAHFAAMARDHHPQTVGPDPIPWLDRLEADHDNLRRALACAPPGVALGMAADLWRFWEIRGHYAEGRAWLSAVLAAAPTEPTLERARALLGAGGLAYAQGDHIAASEAQAEAARTAARAGDRPLAARAGNNLGLTLLRLGRLEEARDRLEEAMSFFAASGERKAESAALNNLGLAHFWLGDPESARACHERSLEIGRELGDPRGVAYCLNGLAKLLTEMGRYDEARDRYKESLRIKRELGDRAGIASGLGNLGILLRKQGDLNGAERLQREALELRVELGLRHGILEALVNFAEIAAARGRAEQAATLMGAAEALAAELSSPVPEPHGDARGALAAALREHEAARARGVTIGPDEAVAYALSAQP